MPRAWLNQGLERRAYREEPSETLGAVYVQSLAVVKRHPAAAPKAMVTSFRTTKSN